MFVKMVFMQMKLFEYAWIAILIASNAMVQHLMTALCVCRPISYMMANAFKVVSRECLRMVLFVLVAILPFVQNVMEVQTIARLAQKNISFLLTNKYVFKSVRFINIKIKLLENVNYVMKPAIIVLIITPILAFPVTLTDFFSKINALTSVQTNFTL